MIAALLAILLSVFARSAPSSSPSPIPTPRPLSSPVSQLSTLNSKPLPPRERLLLAASAYLGTTEATGRNDGATIDQILSSVGLEGTGAPYCAAFNRFAYDRAGLRTVAPRSALAAVWVAPPTWKKGQGRTPLPGDPWGIYFANKGRVAHTGLVKEWRTAVVITIEANTSPEPSSGEADRNGDGIWSKRRLTRQIYAARNWLD